MKKLYISVIIWTISACSTNETRREISSVYTEKNKSDSPSACLLKLSEEMCLVNQNAELTNLFAKVENCWFAQFENSSVLTNYMLFSLDDSSEILEISQRTSDSLKSNCKVKVLDGKSKIEFTTFHIKKGLVISLTKSGTVFVSLSNDPSNGESENSFYELLDLNGNPIADVVNVTHTVLFNKIKLHLGPKSVEGGRSSVILSVDEIINRIKNNKNVRKIEILKIFNTKS